MRRWVRLRRVRYCILCVWSPVCHHANKEVGFRWQTTATCAWWSFTCSPLHCLSRHLPSSVWSFVLTRLCGLYIYSYIYYVWFVCSQVSHGGQSAHGAVLSPKFPTFDAFTVGNSSPETELILPVYDALIWRRTHSVSNWTPPLVDFVFVELHGPVNKKINTLFIYLFFSQAELTFCAGDVITVFGEIDEDGFYYVSTTNLKFWKLKVICI